MKKEPIKNLIEWIRNKLNSLPEKDNQENNYRVGWQFLTYLAGSAAEESSDPQIRMLGKAAKKGAKKSFIDLVAVKITDLLFNPSNNPYLTKQCSYCGNWVSTSSNFCPYCYGSNEF